MPRARLLQRIHIQPFTFSKFYSGSRYKKI